MAESRPAKGTVSLAAETPGSFAANDADVGWRVLLAHDGKSTTCNGLFDAIASALGKAQIIDAPSAEAARATLRRTAVDVVFVCLDLPPAPSGGIRFAQELVRVGCPLVLVTRSLRWLPRTAAELRVLPWIAPEAPPSAVMAAIEGALGEKGTSSQITFDSLEDLVDSQRASDGW